VRRGGAGIDVERKAGKRKGRAGIVEGTNEGCDGQGERLGGREVKDIGKRKMDEFVREVRLMASKGKAVVEARKTARSERRRTKRMKRMYMSRVSRNRLR
jgi:hypothetical protein